MIKNKIFQRLIFATVTLFLVAHCSRESNPVNSGTPTISKPGLAGQTHQLINDYRKANGLSALRYDDNVAEIALTHSRNMADGSVAFSHNGFNDRATEMADILSISAAAENVAWNRGYSDPVQKAVDGWIDSEGHLKNIIGNYNTTGIGVAMNDDGEYYFTQLFAKTN